MHLKQGKFWLAYQEGPRVLSSSHTPRVLSSSHTPRVLSPSHTPSTTNHKALGAVRAHSSVTTVHIRYILLVPSAISLCLRTVLRAPATGLTCGHEQDDEGSLPYMLKTDRQTDNYPQLHTNIQIVRAVNVLFAYEKVTDWPWLRRLVAGLSPRRPGFDPRPLQGT